jgi:hypothetical protein
MSDPLEFLPGYVPPLTDKEHARIGRIAILWGHIEHFVEELLPHVTRLSREELAALQISSKTIASKVDFLTAASSRVADPDYRAGIKAFCSIIHETKGQRNHVFHGIWGWRGDDRRKRVFPAARKETDLHKPFPASGLPALERKLCKCSRMGFDLVITYAYGQRVRAGPSRFIHYNYDGDAPQWLVQWSERNPWDCDDPDRIELEGQLPRLSKLHPER